LSAQETRHLADLAGLPDWLLGEIADGLQLLSPPTRHRIERGFTLLSEAKPVVVRLEQPVFLRKSASWHPDDDVRLTGEGNTSRDRS